MGYRGKVEQQAQARTLRAEGLTLADIASRLDVSKGSVSRWVRDVAVPPRPGRTAARRRAPNALQRAKQAEVDRLRAEGRARLGRLSEREFLVAGAALYAGEGSKRDGEVAFTNSDARMMAFFCAWLRHAFAVDERRLRVRLYLHEGLDLQVAQRHWMRVTDVPLSRFTRPYRAVADPSIRTAKHVHGCATVRYSCSATHRAVMGLIEALFVAPRDPG